MPNDLQSDFPRGSMDHGTPVGPSAGFESRANIAQTGSLQFQRPNKEGQLFLGVIDADIQKQRLPDGRMERYALSGRAIGVPDDRHIITIAGSRSGKGRSVIVPNLITYPGSVLAD